MVLHGASSFIADVARLRRVVQPLSPPRNSIPADPSLKLRRRCPESTFFGAIFLGKTIWLWHSQFALENPPIFKFGKPSISIGHGFHGYVSHNQRLVELKLFVCRLVPTISIHFYPLWMFPQMGVPWCSRCSPLNHQELGSPKPFGSPTQRWSNSLGRSIDASPSPRVHQRHGGVKDG